MSRPTKIVVVGATGLIGRRHLQHVVDEPEAELVGIIDPDAKAPELALSRKCRHFQNVDELLISVKDGLFSTDAVILATPTSTHATLAQNLVHANLAVLVEKPLAVTGAEGRSILQACQQSTDAGGKGLVMVGHHRRHNFYAMAVKKAINEGKLGRIIAINGVWAMRKPMEYFTIPWRQQLGSGGVILTNASHEIDILQYLLGDVAEVYSVEGPKERSFPVDETVLTTMKFASGVVGSFLFSDAAASPHSWEGATGENPFIPTTRETCLTILGTKSSMSIPSLTRFHYDDRPTEEQNWTFPLARDESLKQEQQANEMPPLTRQLKHFIASVRGEVQPNCSIEDGLKTVLVIEAMFKSLTSHVPVMVEQL